MERANVEEFFEIYKGVVAEYVVSINLKRICLKIIYDYTRKMSHLFILGIVIGFLLGTWY